MLLFDPATGAMVLIGPATGARVLIGPATGELVVIGPVVLFPDVDMHKADPGAPHV